jgi:phage protein D
MSSIQLLPDIYVPTFDMKVERRALNPAIAKTILDISVTEHLSPPSQFQFQLNDPQLELIKPEDGLFKEGTRVEISLGFVGNTRRMMDGEISALTANFPNSGPATLQVEGFDLMHRLTRGTIYRPFGLIADSQIVTRIAKEDGHLSASVDPTPPRTEPRFQKHKTNLDFLEELADENNYFLWIDGDTLYFKKEQPAPNTVKLERGKTLMSFSPRLSTAGQVNAVEVRGWNPKKGESVSARAKRSGAAVQVLAPTGRQQIAQGAGGRSERVIEYARVTNFEEAKAVAEKILRDQNRTLITGNGSAAGPPGIRPGTILDLSNVGRFDGEYVVEQVTHSIGSGGYNVSFGVKRRL